MALRKKFLRKTEVSSDKIRIMHEYFSLEILTDTPNTAHKRKKQNLILAKTIFLNVMKKKSIAEKVSSTGILVFPNKDIEIKNTKRREQCRERSLNVEINSCGLFP